MMMLCEALLKTPVTGAYERHVYLEAKLKPAATDTQRTYLWVSVDDEHVRVRRECQHRDAEWKPVAIPTPGTIIRFNLDTQVRVSVRRSAWPWPLPSQRVGSANYMQNLRWIDHAAEKCGIKIRGVDYDPIKIPITKPNHSFIMKASRFRGIGTVTDPGLLIQALGFGIGNAKAFGQGFLNFNVIQG
jgi:hypothetical protein